MAKLLRKLEKAYARKGYTMVRNGGHIVVMKGGHVTCDMDLTGMDHETLLRNVELLLLVVTQ